MNKVSFSQYTTWANCPEAWKLKYIDGHKEDGSTIHTIFGTAMHEVIQEWLHTLYNVSETVARSVDLEDSLKEKLYKEFKASVRDTDGAKVFPCDRPTLEEFYHQGLQILSYVQDNHKKIFPTNNEILAGIEYPIDVEVRAGVRYIGFVDIITKNNDTGIYTLYDLKTSKSGWSSYQKNDKIKTSQLLLYKKFIADHFDVPLDHVMIEYVILKRIISENSPYPIPRVSSFEPPHGKPSITRAWADFEKFLDECFDNEGNYRVDMVKHKASKTNCRWCAFRDRSDLCKYGVK